MRIAVNTRFLLPGKMEGFGWYSYETLRKIVVAHPEHEFIFLFDRPFDQRFVFASNVTPVVIGPQARHPFLFWIWFEVSVKRALLKYKADVFVSPDGYLSLGTNVPSVAVMHDLNFEHYPKDLGWLVRNYYKRYFPKFARKADRIVTVSESSRKDIIDTYGISPEKIDVSYNGVNEDLHPLTPDECEKVREQYTEGKPYFIFVGALHPRKNLARLFHAYDLFCDRNKNSHKLVIVGEKYLWNSEINTAFSRMKHRESVVFTGHLPMEQLGNVLAAARALVFVSVFEGFGLPIVEAMRCEVPVITSSVSCMPEIAGGAALLCDPFSVEAIAEALDRMANDSGLREQLIAKGKENGKRFSWNHAAEGLWNSIEKTLHAKK